MAGRPQARARAAAAAAAREQIAQSKRTEERMGGREFTGHDPPMPPKPEGGLTLQQIEAELGEAMPEQLHSLAGLWPLAHAALEDILRDPEASPASKVSAAKIVKDARDMELKAAAADRPTVIVFETAAYVPVEAA